MTRVASCSCGSLRVTAEGEPQAVVACHCVECQRRTGSVFGVGAYYPIEQLSMSGESQLLFAPDRRGPPVHHALLSALRNVAALGFGQEPGLVGIAVGAFADASFPPPVRSVWERSKHDWVDVEVASQHFDKGRV